VPDDSAYLVCPEGLYWVHTPVPSYAGSYDAAPMMCEPGATMSGLTLLSPQGPRLEKPTMSWALFADVSVTPQPSVPIAL